MVHNYFIIIFVTENILPHIFTLSQYVCTQKLANFTGFPFVNAQILMP